MTPSTANRKKKVRNRNTVTVKPRQPTQASVPNQGKVGRFRTLAGCFSWLSLTLLGEAETPSLNEPYFARSVCGPFSA